MSGARAAQVRARIDALSDVQRRALAERLASAGHRRGSERLVAFIVVGDASPPTDDELRAFLAARVPEYMIPARFVTLDSLPRTSAGKLDRRALANAVATEPTTDASVRAAAPRTETETRLVAIWKDVLKVDEVRIHDDFFEIGGDSLLSIRVIARAGREGIRIAPDRFFERPTIAHMAAAVDSNAERDSTTRSGIPTADAIGEAPLTPIQHWFLDAITRHRDHWNQSYLLELGHVLEPRQVGAVVRELVTHHDALRLRLRCRDGRWLQEFPAPDAEPPFRTVDLRSVAPGEYSTRVVEECEREHGSLRLEDGRLFRCVLFEGDAGWRRILLLGHHLVLDSISWSVILEDLATLVTQAASGHRLRLPRKTAPPRAWAIALAERAALPSVGESADQWLRLPVEPVDARPGCNRDAEVASIALGIDESRRLLQEAPRRLDATAQPVLLAALLMAWHDWTGSDALRIDLEGHGRDVLGEAMDVSRTVGWFTTVFPVHLSLPSDSPNGSEPEIDAVVRAVRGALDALPMRGAAHGLTRYLAPDESVRAALAAQPRPAVLFNHLGTHDLTLPAASRLRVTDEPQGLARSVEAPRPYVLEINARVECGALIVAVEYSRQAHSPASMERFVGALRGRLEGIARGSSLPVAFSAVDASSLAIVADLLAELDEA